MTDNVPAFLALIRHAEGTDRAPDPYRVCFGFKHTIADLSDHPAVTGEWEGEPLDFLGPRYAGEVSTAAGAYQIIRPTWLACKKRLNLLDFGQVAQDSAAVLLIRQQGAIDYIGRGEVNAAIDLCKGVWASLPGSTSGQPQAKLADLFGAYTRAGGAFA